MVDELIKKIKTIQYKYVEQANKDMEGMSVPEQKKYINIKNEKMWKEIRELKKRYKELKYIF